MNGRWQMAIDRWLLHQGQPALRLYRWQRPCLSIGRHQRQLPERWLELAAHGTLELVRRPSGGGAVLHGGDLSYCLVWPQAPGDRALAYRRACAWLQLAFIQMGQPLRFGEQPAGLPPRNCFATSTAADLVHPSPLATGAIKRVGSAQVWRGGVLLQHGSIQLDPDPDLWREVFGTKVPELPALNCSATELEATLVQAAAAGLPQLQLPSLVGTALTADELMAVTASLDCGRISAPLTG